MNLAKTGKIAFVSLVLAILITSMIPIMTPTRVNAADNVMTILPVQNTYNVATTPPGSRFNVTSRLENGTSINSWQVQIEWVPGILNCTGMFIPPGSIFNFDVDVSPIIDNFFGTTTIGSTQLSNPPASGSDDLCIVEFEILTVGTSHINYSSPYGVDTFLLNVDLQTIPGILEDASFQYVDNLAVTISPFGETQVNFGDTVTYTATATNGSEPYTYKWFFREPDGTEVDTGVTTSTFTTPPIRNSTAYRTTVQVTDFAGFARNASATAKVRLLSATISPQDKIVDVLDSATFTLTITGGVPQYLIRWFKNDTLEPSFENFTTATFTFDLPGTVVVKAIVTDAGGTNATALTNVHVLTAHNAFLNIEPAGGATVLYSNMTQELLVNVTVSAPVDYLWGWQMNLTWDPTVLSFIEVILPSDHVFAAFTSVPTLPVDVPGSLGYGVSLVNLEDNFTGSGRLAQVRFKIERYPEPLLEVTSQLSFANKYVDTFLLDPLLNTIPMHSEENMTFHYIHAPIVEHHVAAFGDAVFWTYSNASILANSIIGNTADWSITFNAYGNAGSIGFVNVTIPKASLRGEPNWVSILVNGTNIMGTATKTEDATNTYWYFPLPEFASTITIKVIGTIPEPLPMLMLALTIGSLIAIALVRRFPRRKQLL